MRTACGHADKNQSGRPSLPHDRAAVAAVRTWRPTGRPWVSVELGIYCATGRSHISVTWIFAFAWLQWFPMVSNDPSSPPLPTADPEPRDDVTGLLIDWQSGDVEAQERLLPMVYSELHRLARLYLSGENVGHTLQATALVNEAYLKLIDQTRVSWQNRAQFFGVAARMMRRILVDHARERRAAKRGGGAWKLSLDDVGDIEGRRELDLVDLDAALVELAAFDAQQSRLVELRFFAGLTIRETAEALDISPATVKREWNMAKAWLYRRMTQGG